MSRFLRSFTTLLLLAVTVFGGALHASAQVGPQTARRIDPAARRVATPPPLPMPAASAIVGAQDATKRGLGLSPAPNMPRPPMPTIAELRRHHGRMVQSASGATISLTGDANNYYIGDQTLPYAAQVFWLCNNVTPNATYQYVVFPPRGTASTTGNFTADASGRCFSGGGGAYYANFTLATPLGSGTDPAYSAVWAVAIHDTSKAAGYYDAVAYTVVQSTQHFQTYADSSLTLPAIDFKPGDTVYVNAAGLNPSHTYNIGFVYTSGSGQPCTFAIPAGSGNNNNGTCFVPGGTGTSPSGGALFGQYTLPTAGPNTTGTYSVELFDSSPGEGTLVSTSQISVQPATTVWCLQPYNGGGAAQACSTSNIFATDGLIVNSTGAYVAEQSVTGLYLSVTGGLTNGRTYGIAMSNPNGVVYSGIAGPLGGQIYFGANPTATATGTNLPSTKYAFPLYNTGGNIAAIGPAQTPFAPNVFTFQLFDQTSKVAVASKSFTILGYHANDAWTVPNQAYAQAASPATMQNATVTWTNDAGSLFGTWNADGLKSLVIAQDTSGYVTFSSQAATATDSNGQTWNITVTATSVTATPAVATQFLAPGATLAVPFKFAVATGRCTAACLLQTAITPFDGIAASANNVASAALSVFGSTAVPGTARSTYGLTFGAAPAPLGAPRYNQASYLSGTDGIIANTTANYYPVSLTVNNYSGQTIEDILLTFPTSYDANLANQVPVISSVTLNGVGVTQAAFGGGTRPWNLIRQSSGGTPHGSMNGSNPAQPNQYLLQQVYSTSAGTNCTSTANCKGIPNGQSATFVINMPLFLNAFPFQQITAVADSQTGTSVNVGASFSMSPYTNNTNAIAGFTNIDSTEIAVFELEPAHMQSSFNPSTISTPSAGNVTTTMKFINSQLANNPNPDYVSELYFSVPTGAVPNTITASAPSQPSATWTVTALGGGNYRATLCAAPAAGNPGCTAAADVNALPPGGELDLLFTYTTTQPTPPTVGQYNIAWQAVGANGGAKTLASAPSAFAPLTIANTTAQVSFTNAGGYPGVPSTLPVAVPANTEPSIGSSADNTNGNGFVFHIKNNGSNVITGAKITVPYYTVSGQSGSDGGTPNVFWTVTQFSGQGTPNVYVSGAGAASPGTCSGYVPLTTQVTSGAPGLISLTGCNIAVGGSIDVYFNALNPYLINNEFEFKTTVSSTAPAVANGPTTVPYPKADYMKIVADVRLTIVIPPTGSGTVLPVQQGGSTPATTCTGCSYSTLTGPVINMGLLKNTLPLNSGTFTAADVLNAMVFADTASGWQLYVSVDNNPGVTGGQVSTQVSSNSSAVAGYSRLVTAPTLIPVTGSGVYPTAATGLNLSSYGGALRRPPVDNLMNYIINLSGSLPASPQNQVVTLYYTVIPN